MAMVDVITEYVTVIICLLAMIVVFEHALMAAQTREIAIMVFANAFQVTRVQIVVVKCVTKSVVDMENALRTRRNVTVRAVGTVLVVRYHSVSTIVMATGHV